MRDFFQFPAQTNLELYAQAIECGYDPRRRRALSSAYQFALSHVYQLVRGSGKPFIAHLVGTASLVLASGCHEDWVIAALLHALYQQRVPFAGGLTPDERREVVFQRFGDGVDELVFRYTAFESVDMRQIAPDVADYDPAVLTLRLADELEDLSGDALALHGNDELDRRGLRGSYSWRRDLKTSQSEALLALAEQLDLSGIRHGLERWLQFAKVPSELADMRTGWVSSVNLADESGL